MTRQREAEKGVGVGAFEVVGLALANGPMPRLPGVKP